MPRARAAQRRDESWRPPHIDVACAVCPRARAIASQHDANSRKLNFCCTLWMTGIAFDCFRLQLDLGSLNRPMFFEGRDGVAGTESVTTFGNAIRIKR